MTLELPKHMMVAPRVVFLVRASGLVAAALGFIALLGWVFDWPLLTTFKEGLIPMAPSTAVLFLWYGAAVCLRTVTPLSRRFFRVSLAAGFLGMLISLLLLTLSLLGIQWGVEHLGLNPTATVSGAATGHMSPVTAFCFLIVSISFLASLLVSTTRLWRNVPALAAAGVILGIVLVFLLAYFFGAPLLYGSSFIPPALNTIFAFLMLGLALLLLNGRFTGQAGAGSSTSPPLTLVFAILAAGIITVGYFSYRNFERQHRAEAEDELMAIADLKVSELVNWRKERLGDANTIYNNPAFSTLVQRLFEKQNDTDAQRLLQTWLNRMQTHLDYKQIVLTDATGTMRLSVPQGSPAIPHLRRNAAAVLGSKQVSVLDLHRHKSGDVVHSILIPIFDNQDGHRPLGLLTLINDPNTYLYPFIQRWPTSSPTAETLLVRREENEVVFMNDLRFESNAALNLRVPLDRKELPAVKAVLGTEGIVEGIDYRNEPVLAALRNIQGSPWFLVARRDTSEVYLPLRERLWLTILLMTVLLIFTGAGFSLTWRQQRFRFYRKQLQTAEDLANSERLLAQAEKLGKVGAWEFDIDTQKLTWSDMVYEIHELDRAAHSTVNQGISFYTPESRPIITRAVQNAIEQGAPFDEELEIITAKGNRRQVHAIGTADLERRRVAGFFQDITERKLMEEQLRQSETTVRNKLKAIIEPEGDIGTLALSDIIDTQVLQSLMEDFYKLTGMLGAILDISGKVLVAVGWQDICTKFHRCHPDTLKNCTESDTILTNGVPQGTFKAYQCKNNMWDMVTPLIVGGRHVGNVFIGQFFYEDETPDVELFRKQARQYGFDETAYLAALDRVPRFSRETVDAGMHFYAKLAGIISKLSLSAIQQSRMLTERHRVEKDVRQLLAEANDSRRALLSVVEDQKMAEKSLREAEKELKAHRDDLEKLVYERTTELRKVIQMMSGRENRMAALKEENKKLQTQLEKSGSSREKYV